VCLQASAASSIHSPVLAQKSSKILKCLACGLVSGALSVGGAGLASLPAKALAQSTQAAASTSSSASTAAVQAAAPAANSAAPENLAASGVAVASGNPAPTGKQKKRKKEAKPPSQPSAKQREKDGLAADDAYLAGAKLLEHKDLEGAEREFRRAAQLAPARNEYLLAAEAMRQSRVAELVQKAGKDRLLGKDAEAETLLAQARTIDPDNTFLLQHPVPGSLQAALLKGGSGEAGEGMSSWIMDGPRLAGAIELRPKPGVQSFHIHGDLQDALRQVAAAYGIKASFDESVKRAQVKFDLDDVTYAQAMHVLEAMGTLFEVPMDSSTVLFARDTQEKRASLEHLLQETIYLPGMSTSELAEIGNMIRNVFEVKQLNMANDFDTIVVRAPAESIRVLNLTLADLLQGNSQVVFDLKLYTISKSMTKNLGVTIPTQVGAYNVASAATQLVQANQTVVNQAIAQGLIPAGLSNLDIAAALVYYGLATSPLLSGTIAFLGNGISATGIYSSDLAAQMNLALSSSDTRALDDIQLRADDHGLATFKVGSRYPITQSTYSTSTPSTGTTGPAGATVNGVSVSSLLAAATTETVPQVQYEDLGLTLKATPTLGRYGRVSLHLELSITALQGTSVDNIPILDNSQFTSDITVEDGGTATLVSNLTRDESGAVTGVPGLSDLPGFQSSPNLLSTTDESQLVMVLTPHIVRRRLDETHGPLIPIAIPTSVD
jgi:general secretion pathway protein D